MDPNAENVIQNVGAIAETASIFYNSISGRVPKDVALVLTQHFMELSMARKPSPNLAAILAAVQAAEARRRAEQQKQPQEQNSRSSAADPPKPEPPQSPPVSPGETPA